MNTNTIAMNINEMDMVNGGGTGFFTDRDSRISSIADGAIGGMIIGGFGCSLIGACAAGPIGGLTGGLIGLGAGTVIGGIIGGVTYEGDNWA